MSRMNFGKPQIRLVIADDHPIVRKALRCLLDAEPDFKVVGEAADVRKAVKLATELKPDILLLGLAMPKHQLEALRELSVPTNASPVKVLLLTLGKGQIVEALQLGARGVVPKQFAVQVLLKAIRTVMAGEYWVGRESVSSLNDDFLALQEKRADQVRRALKKERQEIMTRLKRSKGIQWDPSESWEHYKTVALVIWEIVKYAYR